MCKPALKPAIQSWPTCPMHSDRLRGHRRCKWYMEKDIENAHTRGSLHSPRSNKAHSKAHSYRIPLHCCPGSGWHARMIPAALAGALPPTHWCLQKRYRSIVNGRAATLSLRCCASAGCASWCRNWRRAAAEHPTSSRVRGWMYLYPYPRPRARHACTFGSHQCLHGARELASRVDGQRPSELLTPLSTSQVPASPVAETRT
ncbi:hypothetical protein B0H13DRAFT_2261012 [Mycena leptocephala]|nr:hypothetical protein B0H13DRAFT_2261012 [Mycena leptocephala]